MWVKERDTEREVGFDLCWFWWWWGGTGNDSFSSSLEWSDFSFPCIKKGEEVTCELI